MFQSTGAVTDVFIIQKEMGRRLWGSSVLMEKTANRVHAECGMSGLSKQSSEFRGGASGGFRGRAVAGGQGPHLCGGAEASCASCGTSLSGRPMLSAGACVLGEAS